MADDYDLITARLSKTERGYLEFGLQLATMHANATRDEETARDLDDLSKKLKALKTLSERMKSRDVYLNGQPAEILPLLMRGYSTEEMAEELFLSPRTVKNYVNNILRAFGVSSRAKLVAVLLGLED